MIPRVLEAEAMDTAEEALAYDTMDHSLANQAFVADLLAAGPQPGWIVDLGAGTLQIPILMCREFPSCRILAIDLARWMLRIGWAHVQREALGHRIFPCRADAKRLPLPSSRFATVVSNSLLHHLADPVQALAEAYRILAPGGLLFFRDLFRPPDESTVEALVKLYALDATPAQQRMFADSFHASLTVDEVSALAAQVGIPAEAVFQSSDRHWTLSWRKTGKAS